MLLNFPTDTRMRLSKLVNLWSDFCFCHGCDPSAVGCEAGDCGSTGADDGFDASDFSKMRGVCDTNRTFSNVRSDDNLAAAVFAKRRIIFTITNFYLHEKKNEKKMTIIERILTLTLTIDII